MTALLREEAQAWRDLTAAEYDAAVCRMFDQFGTGPYRGDQIEASIALASATLRRNSPKLHESRVRCAEFLLGHLSAARSATLQSRTSLLVLLAWLQLGAVVERGPESIATAPDLPAGVVLPTGADPLEIADPVLRAQAFELVEDHRDNVDRWRAKQRALGHLDHLARLVHGARGHFVDDRVAQELVMAMALAPGIPSELRRSLQHGSS